MHPQLLAYTLRYEILDKTLVATRSHSVSLCILLCDIVTWQIARVSHCNVTLSSVISCDTVSHGVTVSKCHEGGITVYSVRRQTSWNPTFAGWRSPSVIRVRKHVMSAHSSSLSSSSSYPVRHNQQYIRDWGSPNHSSWSVFACLRIVYRRKRWVEAFRLFKQMTNLKTEFNNNFTYL